MKIISYNVNGIRAAMRKDLIGWVKEVNPDVLCLQETKAQNGQYPIFDFEELGYRTYWYAAKKKGYSGVAIITKKEPDHVEYGMGIDKYDDEGRFIRADYGDLSVVSVYHPSGSSGDERQAFKMQWLDDYLDYITELKKTRPNLVLSGDYNICHEAIDIHDPVRNAKVSGFLPEERDWLTKFINSGFYDSFRYFVKEPHHYSWWSYRANARANNKGWRIDYHMVSDPLAVRMESAKIHPDAKHSDHCPIELKLKG